MKAMLLTRIVAFNDCAEPLEPAEVPRPVPGSGDVLIRVSVCGVCHTELDEIEGRTAPPRLPVIPGHQVVGRVEQTGAAVTTHRIGDRIGVGWIFSSGGGEFENLSPQFLATGRDADGGYAEFMTVPADYAIPIPEGLSDLQAAPLLCAGAVGYRALRLTGLTNGQRLGLTGFGGSAHLVLQLARHQFPDSPVFVFARDPEARRFALELGAAWAGDTTDHPGEGLHAIIDTTPAWKPVVAALACLLPRGRLVINAIRKEDGDIAELTRLSYHDHLWMEREIKSVANVTRFDIAQFLAVAAEIPLNPTVTTYPLEDANVALSDLHRKSVIGAKVLVVDPAVLTL